MKIRLIKTLEQIVSDELLKCFIASNALFIRKIHSIQMKELVSCKYLTLSSPEYILFLHANDTPRTSCMHL